MWSDVSRKYASLLALVVQQTVLVIMIRYSKMQMSSFTSSTAVVLAEVVKVVMNLSLELVSSRANEAVSWRTVLNKWWNSDILSLAPPAFLYMTQNNLLFVALSNLSVPVYQVTSQGKLLTTALFSRLILKRKVAGTQYVSLLTIAMGVGVVLLSNVNTEKAALRLGLEQNMVIGIFAVACSCATSGFAGVCFESVLKSTEETSLYIRNAQLAMWSVVLGVFLC
mmetsp:Transcript_22897/g.57873  ORF Transcript_22897/g.57873 Transcript_22897/m.57873 type:complete len:224 (-) Transcript_22897:1747-2418(-)